MRREPTPVVSRFTESRHMRATFALYDPFQPDRHIDADSFGRRSPNVAASDLFATINAGDGHGHQAS